jgi:hypothetical protein
MVFVFEVPSSGSFAVYCYFIGFHVLFGL